MVLDISRSKERSATGWAYPIRLARTTTTAHQRHPAQSVSQGCRDADSCRSPMQSSGLAPDQRR
jgi:hypothetical protein